MRYFLFILLFLCSFYLHATDLTTPHTFSAGTPALASQVNENFQAHAAAINSKAPNTIVKVNGQKIGWIYSHDTSEMVVLSDKGSIAYLSTTGEIANAPEMHTMRAFYPSADCSGPAYISTGGVVWEYNVFRNNNHLIFWDSVSLTAYYTNFPAQAISVNSMMYSLEEGCYAFPTVLITAFPVLPNDPNITGFSFIDSGSDSLSLQNITFEIQ